MDHLTNAGHASDPVYIFTALAFAACMLLESVLPRRKLEGNLAWRWSNNFALGAVSWYVNAVAGSWFVIWLSSQESLRSLALVPERYNQNTVLGFLLLLTVTQFVSYWTHIGFHRIRWLWPLHAVHHADTEVDVSTGYRHHPLEPLITLPLVAPLVVLLGSTPEATAAYRLFAVGATIFSHANLRIPEWIERHLRKVLLTPDFHRIHHCAEERFTNSNYGSLVPWFDYLFGTAKHRDFGDQETMQTGLEFWRDPRDSRLDRQLTLPLLKLAGKSDGQPQSRAL